MTDNRTYTRYDADGDVDSEQMTHYDPHDVIASLSAENLRLATDNTRLRIDAIATRQQLAEAMTMCAELSAENERLTAELERQQDMATHAIQAYRVEKQRADDAVAAYHVIAARLCGMGWYC